MTYILSRDKLLKVAEEARKEGMNALNTSTVMINAKDQIIVETTVRAVVVMLLESIANALEEETEDGQI